MKSAWITGASSGIGYNLAKLLADNGWQVLATARSEKALLELEDYSDNIKALPADLTLDQDIKSLDTFFVLRDAPLDAIVVNAGTCEYMDNARLDMASMRRVFDINVFAAVASINVALPWLRRAGGHIAGISSMSVYLPFTRAEYYGASKAAFSYYLDSLRVDLKPAGVSVSQVYPGFVETQLTQKNDFYMPFMVSAQRAAKDVYSVLLKKPVKHAFPRTMHYLLKTFACCLPLWRYLHKSQTVPSV